MIRRRFGQHWLHDEQVLAQIVKAADLQPDDRILEVGPGHGALTKRLLASSAALIHAIELDRNLVEVLQNRFGSHPKFSLQQGDVLQASLRLADASFANKVVANIPYNITGPLLGRLIGRLDRPANPTYECLVLLIQKEVAERIRAKPGQSGFSALSVRMQLLAHCSWVCSVPPCCFQPPPKVESEAILLKPFPPEKRLESGLASQVEWLLKRVFQTRRKMLRNTLTSVIDPRRLELVAASIGINLQQRPQEVAAETWVDLARGLNLNT
ncbi:16S rRNA (adenine(1518)-N(6)/adenine(1519)-N(6))-dimethyltransferase RsmA [Synechococcus sp. M16CYN]|uniref:16S rRNA (adenine(1518)-N(6)/adenine(1519)-N(6))- dimethyltransferase RsmA n=1 Tax=Synechococcus sp. M16CYN TaxID=3103139 RepID=UPI003244ACB7